MSYFNYEPEFLTDDPGFLRLKPEAGYLFTLLANRMLRHGHLAPDKEFYRLLWGIRFQSFSRAWDAAIEAFPRDDLGFIYLSWTDDLRSDSLEHLKSGRERQKRHRMAKRERELSQSRHSDVPVTSQVCHAPTEGRTEGRTEKIPEAVVPEVKPRPAKKSPTGPHAECFEHWKAEWARTRNGADYLGAKKDFVAIAELLKASTPEEVKRRMTLMATDPDPWITKNASPAMLRSKWNTYDGIPSNPSTTRLGSADYLPELS